MNFCDVHIDDHLPLCNLIRLEEVIHSKRNQLIETSQLAGLYIGGTLVLNWLKTKYSRRVFQGTLLACCEHLLKTLVEI